MVEVEARRGAARADPGSSALRRRSLTLEVLQPKGYSCASKPETPREHGTQGSLSYIRIHLCQLHFWPAYFDATGSLTAEVAPAIEQDCRLSQLRQYTAVADCLKENEREYNEFLKLRAESVIDFAKKRSARILVFPEYSIPAVAVSHLREAAKTAQMIVIFGTHRVKVEAISFGSYSDWTFVNPTRAPVVGSAICPILTADGKIIALPKATRSKWEPSLTTDSCRERSFTVQLDNGRQFRFAVFICIDALHTQTVGEQISAQNTDAVIVSALTPSLEEFHQLGEQLSREEIELLVCNIATFGGSFCHLHRPDAIFGIGDPSYPPSANVEAVVEIDLPTSDPLRIRGTVRTEGARRHPRVFLAAEEDNAWLKEYKAAASLVKESLARSVPDLEGARDVLYELVVQRGLTPEHIVNRLRHVVRQHLDYFEGNAEDVNLALELLTIKAVPVSKFLASRAVRARSALDQIEEALRTADDDVFESVSKCLRKLLRKYPTQQARGLVPKPSQGENRAFDESTLAWFKGRGDLFDKLEQFFRAGSKSRTGLLLTGVRGVGKTSSLRALFPKSLNRLSPEWIAVPQGASFATVIARIAESRGVDLDIDFLHSASRRVFQNQSKKLVDSIFGAKRAPLIVDDIGDMQQDGRNAHQFQIFMEEVSSGSSGASKLVFVCSRAHPYSKLASPFFDVIHVPPLTLSESDHALRWYVENYGKSLGSGKPKFPHQLLQYTGGHPLGIRLLAQVMTQEEVNAALLKGTVPMRAARDVVAGLLPDVKLSAQEKTLLAILAVLREPLPPNELRDIVGAEVPLEKILDECTHKAIVDYDGDRYSVHSLFRVHFYELTSEDERGRIHSKLADLYQRRVMDRRSRGILSLPQMAELAYHLMGAGRLRELKLLAAGVASEALPIARRFYLRNKNNPEAALSKYEILAELLPEEPNVRAYVGRCYGRLKDDARRDEHFMQAIDLAKRSGQRVGWLYRDWGHMRSTARDWEGCLECFNLARLNGQDDASMLATEGMVAWRMHGDIEAALELLERAGRAQPEHEYVQATLIRVLREAISRGYAEFSERLKDAEHAHPNAAGGRGSVSNSSDDWEYAEGEIDDGEPLSLEG